MPEGQSPLEAPARRGKLWPRRKRWQFALGVALMLIGMVAYAWITREQIARDIISDELQRLEIPATYVISSIGPGEQVLRDVVLGDPDRPDFTADEVRVQLVYGLGAPQIGRIALTNPRLYGEYSDGKLSFGTLDNALFAPSDEPAALPDFDLELRDARALIESDFGEIGIKAEGSGNLPNGFSGVLAVSAPDLSYDDCSVGKLTAFGSISSSDGLPAFNGPLRLKGLDCPASGFALASLDWQLELSAESDFSGFDAGGGFDGAAIAATNLKIERVTGDLDFSSNGEGLRSRFDVGASNASYGALKMAELAFEGDLRADTELASISSDLSVSGQEFALSPHAKSQINSAVEAAGLPFLGPLSERLQHGLANAESGNSLRARASVRTSPQDFSVSIPQALLSDRADETIASFSRVQLRFLEGTSVPSLAGNAMITGRDLPQISARVEQGELTSSVTRIRMEPFEAGDASIAIPALSIAQGQAGILRFSGAVLADGEVAENIRAEQLAVPLEGRWSPSSGLAMVTRCGALTARAIVHPRLALDRAEMQLCPNGQAAGLRLRDGSVEVDFEASGLAISGKFDDQPVSISGGKASFSTASGLSAQQIELTLGSGESITRLTLESVQGARGEGWSGTFEGAEFGLGIVPLDISRGSGTWTYTNAGLSLNDGILQVADRQSEPRFEPLVSRDAELTFADGTITARSTLREPFSDRLVTNVALSHVFETGEGRADMLVEDLLFDEALQPAAGSDVCLNRETNPVGYRPGTPGLTCLAFGIIANVTGAVSGQGEIAWDADGVASTGAFTTSGANMAAAFGPLEGVSGTIEFTDLLALTTAPAQVVSIDKINPGVEVFDGQVIYNLRDAQVLEIEAGRWPFLGGMLALEPVVLDFREPQDRRYVFRIDGLDAARFVEQMELGNIGASGVFDGEVPIIFDTDGNGRIERGLLRSRPPGGNVSYIGELTYEDLGAMANFAFQSLRSLDFTDMQVEMNGPLTGEIITRLKFQGVSQGEGADSNFVTKQIARLPIEFRVNIRADFYSLLTNLQSLYDPAFVRDPRGLGLLQTENGRFVVPQPPEMPAIKPEEVDDLTNSDEPAIQPEESEPMP